MTDDDASLRRRQRLLADLTSAVEHFGASGPDVLDLKMARQALIELTKAFEVFRPYRGVRKLTMFGSARTAPHDPIYELARSVAAEVAAAGWMVVTGAGPGIMAAGIEGAGRARSFGVNIELPFEQGANAFIADDPKLVEMRYFFTRKLMLTKESSAFVVLPGGFGTLDETFELLTLLQTGKAEPAPVVLLETPGGTYWHRFDAFLREAAVEPGWIHDEDRSLYRIVRSASEAVDEVLGFYANFRSARVVDGRLILRLGQLPEPAVLAELTARFADLLGPEGLEPVEASRAEILDDDDVEAARLAVDLAGRHPGRFRQLLDALNGR